MMCFQTLDMKRQDCLKLKIFGSRTSGIGSNSDLHGWTVGTIGSVLHVDPILDSARSEAHEGMGVWERVTTDFAEYGMRHFSHLG